MSDTYRYSDDVDGMPAAETFGESILKAQAQISRQMKNPEVYRKRAMYRAISKVIADTMTLGGTN